MAAAPIPHRPDVRPSVTRALRTAVELLAAHPVVALGLGAALVLSLGAVCCGVGLIAAPWLACELVALVVSTARGQRVDRQGGWLRAAGLQAVAVLVSAAAVMVAVTWLGAQLPRDPLRASLLGAGHIPVLLLVAGGSVLALLYMLPFIYAPILLIEHGGSLGSALARSARLVIRGGMGAHLWFSSTSHLIQVAPPLAVAAVALVWMDHSALPVAVAASLPLMAVTVPLGQAMIVASYLERDTAPDAPTSPARPPGPDVTPWMVGIGLMPAAALLLIVTAVTVRPAVPSAGEAPVGELVTAGRLGPKASRFAIPHTGLSVVASATDLAVEAGDGGGGGAVPLPTHTRFDRLRVVRVRDAFAVELGAGSHSYVTWVNRAGVRLDDDLPARLVCHLPPWGLLLLALSMIANALLLGPALAILGATPRAQRRAQWVAAGLVPLHGTTLALGLAALFG